MEAVLDAEMTTVTAAPTKTAAVTVAESQPVQSTAVAVAPKETTKTLREIDGMKFAQLCVTSGLFKDTADVAKAAMKIKLGYALNLDEATAMSGIIIVQGRISFSSALISGRIKQSGKYRYKVLEKTDKKCKIQFYEQVPIYRNGKLEFDWDTPGPPEEFTFEMAKRAGLVKPDGAWLKWPEAMNFARCLTAGARTYCSDVFMGNAPYTPDELDPTMAVTLDDNGDIVADSSSGKSATVATVKKAAAAKKAAKEVEPELSDAELIKEIQSLITELKVETKAFKALYGNDDLAKFNHEQLKDFHMRLKQKQKAMG